MHALQTQDTFNQLLIAQPTLFTNIDIKASLQLTHTGMKNLFDEPYNSALPPPREQPRHSFTLIIPKFIVHKLSGKKRINTAVSNCQPTPKRVRLISSSTNSILITSPPDTPPPLEHPPRPCIGYPQQSFTLIIPKLNVHTTTTTLPTLNAVNKILPIESTHTVKKRKLSAKNKLLKIHNEQTNDLKHTEQTSPDIFVRGEGVAG